MEQLPAAPPAQRSPGAPLHLGARPEPVCQAALQAIDYLSADSIGDVIVKLGAFDERVADDEQTQIMVNALLLLCGQLVEKLADLQGIDQVRVLRKLAAEIIFQHFCASRRQARRERAEQPAAHPADETALVVLHL
jgi:hypothetical protein